jgi:transposase
MEELLSVPDTSLEIISVENNDKEIVLHAISKNTKARCPYCRKWSDKVHSHYDRVLADLPIQGKKAFFVLTNKKYFCLNEKCAHKTFAERFTFFKYKATKTTRLWDMILETSLTQSSISASSILQKNTVKIGKSTICNLLKKKKGSK